MNLHTLSTRLVVCAMALTGAAGSAAAQDPPKPPDGFTVSGFTFRPGGRVKLDVIRDFTRIGNEDSFDTRTIPIDDDDDGGNSNLHAKETRLSLDIRGDVDGDELRMYVETDFYGASSVLRLRHAYGSYKGLLAGQTWTTFMDEDNLPRTIDFESPTAFAQIRQALLRYSRKVGVVTWAAAIEDNKSAITVPVDIPGRAEFPTPDLVGRLRFDFPRGHITTSAFMGSARFRPLDVDDEDDDVVADGDDEDSDLDDELDDNESDTVSLWGTMASANFTTAGRDTAYGVVTFGDGIGRYRGGTTAVPDETGSLHAVRALAFMGGYEHFWAQKWSTNAVYSVGTASDQPFYSADVNRRLTYGAVNLLYWFLGDRGWMGVEYLYGEREVFGGEPNTGSAHRLQYAVRFNLP